MDLVKQKEIIIGNIKALNGIRLHKNHMLGGANHVTNEKMRLYG